MKTNLPGRGSDSKRQEEQVDRIIGVDEQQREEEFATYVLECHCPSSLSNCESEAIPPELALIADQLFYVGCTKGIRSRLLDHVRGRGPIFTETYPPKNVQEIQWFDTAEEGKRREKNLAYKYRAPSIQLDPWGGNGDRFDIFTYALRTVKHPRFAYFR